MGCHLVNYIHLGMLATDIKSINTLNIPTSPSVCTVATKFQGFFFGSQFLSIGDQRKRKRADICVCTKEIFWDKKSPKSPYFQWGGGKKKLILSYLDYRFLYVTRVYSGIWNFFYFSL